MKRSLTNRRGKSGVSIPCRLVFTIIVLTVALILLPMDGRPVTASSAAPNETSTNALAYWDNLVGPEGGEVVTPDGRIRVAVPSGALAQDTYIQLSSDSVRDESTALEFDLQLVAPGAKTAITGFNTPVSVELSVSQDLAKFGEEATKLVFKRLDDQSGEWSKLGGSVDPASGIASFSTNATGRYAIALSEPVDKTTTGSVSTAAGGSLVSDDGLTLDFPPQATSEELRIEYKPHREGEFKASPQNTVREFELNAFAMNRGGAVVSTFEKPVQLTIPHRAEDIRGQSSNTLRLYVWDEALAEWTLVPNQTVTEEGTINASLDHFSVYSTQTSSDIAGPGLNLYHQVDLHSGAASLSYPIEVPVGAGGFQPPPLALSYSSSTVNEMKSRQQHGSWVGIGWDISIPAVVYDPTTGKRFLSLDGTFDELISTGSDAGPPASTRYSTKNERHLRIRGIGLTGTSAATVEVTDKRGRKYLFGGLSLNQPVDSYQRYFHSSTEKVYYRFDLARVIDTNSNYADYFYYRDLANVQCPPNFPSPCKNVRAGYPARIEWGDTNPLDGGAHKFRVYIGETSEASLGAPGLETTRWSNVFGYIRYDSPVCDSTLPFTAPAAMETRRLKELRVQTLVGASWETSRRHTFEYEHTSGATCPGGNPTSGSLKLTRFKQYGRSSSTQPGTQLRDMLFVYGDSMPVTFRPSPNSHCPGSYAPSWPFLRSAGNGLGGTLDFRYVEKWQASGDPNVNCTWARQVIEHKEQHVGSVPGQAPWVYHDYAYEDGPKYYFAPGEDPKDAEFRGFRKVKETDAKGDYKKCHYFTTGLEPDAGFYADNVTGNWFKCEWYDYSPQPAVIKHIDPTWLSAQVAPGVNFVYKAWEWTYADSQAFDTWFTHDGYGNLRSKQERGPEYRWTDTSFFPNTTEWIVSLPAVEVVRNSSTAFSTRTWHYDNEAPALNGGDYSTPPIKGNLTGTWKWEAYAGGVPSGHHREELLKYDAFGNVKERTKYRDNAAILTTTLTYDLTYHAFLTSESFTVQAIPHLTQYQYDFVLGLRTHTTDPNGALYQVQYDEFGRVWKEWEPGDIGSPTREYHHEWDAELPITLPHLTWVSHLESSGGSSFLETSTLYDGLGRAVQQRSEISTGSTCQATVTDTIYDFWDTSLVRSQSVPYASSVAAPCRVIDFTHPNESAARTTTEYDATARKVKVTNPAGASSYRTFTYSGYTETMIDENLHKTETVRDAYGRTVTMNEYSGSPPNPYTLYASTSYEYDALDRQTRITDAASNQTNITYNGLGFRTRLDDPDTGISDYTYYDDGLLNTQRDHRLEVTTMTYDGLGRPTTKSYSGPVAAPTINYIYDVCYIYCADNKPKGRLTKTWYSDNSQTYLYKYDQRGRTTVKQSVIDSTTYEVGHAYDPMNREVATTYPGPGPETVSTSYDTQGQVETVAGTSTYLTSTDRNAAGQPMRLTFGNAKTQDFTYRPDLRLQTLGVSATPVPTYTYTYDPKGNLQTLHDSSIGGGVPQTTTFGYDERDRLKSVSGPTASNFDYDSIGNMTRKDEGVTQGTGRETATQCQNPGDEDGDGKINDGCTTAYPAISYACSPTCSPARPHAVKTASGNNPNFAYNPSFNSTQTYDAAGNLMTISGSNGPGGAAGSLGLLVQNHKSGEGYDAEGRLWKVEYNKLDLASNIAFYDLTGDCIMDGTDLGLVSNAFGLGVGQTGYNPRYDINSDGYIDTTDTTYFTGAMFGKSCPKLTYDPDGQLVKLDGPKRVVYIDGIYEDSGAVTKYYFADGRRIAMRTSGSPDVVRYLANDHLGSTAFVLNSSGALESHVRYYPYGMTWSQSAAPATDRLFTGHQQLGGRSGTYYAGARNYSADTGRFTQADSLVLGARRDPQILNRFSYVGNNPTNYVDPTGMFMEGIGWAPWGDVYWPFTPSPGTAPPRPRPIVFPTESGGGGDCGTGVDLGGFISGGCDTAGELAGGAGDLGGDAAALTTDVLSSQRFWDCFAFTLDATGFAASVFFPGNPYSIGVQFGTQFGSFVIGYASNDWEGVAYSAAAAAMAPTALSPLFQLASTVYAFRQCTGI